MSSLTLITANVAIGNATTPIHCFRTGSDGILRIGRDQTTTPDTCAIDGNVVVANACTVGESLFALGNLEVSGMTTITEVRETFNTKTGATGVVSHDFATGGVWMHTGMTNNFTPNFVNVPTANSKLVSTNLILIQGSTPYVANAVQIAGNSQTINWLGGVTPLGTSNGVDVQNFVLLRSSDAWTVLSSLASFND